jgi:hypothetical protein
MVENLKRVSKRHNDEYEQIEENVVNDDEEDVDECQWQSQKSTERGIGLKVFLILFLYQHHLQYI